MMAQATFALGLFSFATLLALSCKAKAQHIKHGPPVCLVLEADLGATAAKAHLSR